MADTNALILAMNSAIFELHQLRDENARLRAAIKVTHDNILFMSVSPDNCKFLCTNWLKTVDGAIYGKGEMG